MLRLLKLLNAGLFAAVLVISVHARGEARKTATAVRVEPGAIVIDGRVDEPAWQAAPLAAAFTERTPVAGRVPAAATEVRFLYDDDALYVAVSSDSLAGEKPRGLELARDAFRIFSDDTITLKFDVFYDKRTTIGFAVNVSNAQLDYIALDTGSGFRREFDAIWESDTTTVQGRWNVEFRIPFVSLGLPRKEGPRVLGVNVTRDHNAANATYDWSPMRPEFGPVNALFYGDLLGIEGVTGGVPVSLMPYARFGFDNVPTQSLPIGSRFTTLAGGEVRVRVTNSFWAEGTVLTDFAQVDLDDEIINLDRFPLFLPEKRAFFLNGVDVFEFGAPQRAQVYFSRRIGLDDSGAELPIYGGAKLYGRTGALRLGILNIVTGDPTTNWLVTRARYQVGDNADIGIIGTVQTSKGAGSSYTGGADLRWLGFERRLQLTGFWASTRDRDNTWGRETMASQGRLAWLGKRAQPSVGVLWVEPQFDPAVGFVRRTDLLQVDPTMAWVERAIGGWIDRLTMSAGASQLLSADVDTQLGYSGRLSVDSEFRSGVFARIDGSYREDVVDEAFELAGKTTIDAGAYRGPRVTARAGVSGRTNPSGSVTYDLDAGFFGGRRHSVTGTLDAAFGKHFRLQAGGTASRIDVPSVSPFRTWAVNGVFTVTPSTQLSADLLGRVNSVEETVTGLLRVRWRYLPGSDMFLVFREEHNWGAGLSERGVTVKVTYRYDLQL